MQSSGAFFNEFAAEFDTLYDGKRSPFMQWFDQRFRQDMFVRFDLTFQYLGDLKGKSILDIGCGSGPYIVEALKRDAEHVTGIDPAKNMLTLSQKRVADMRLLDKVLLLQGYFPEFRPNQKYDHAIVMGVMDYVFDADTFLDGIRSTVANRAVLSFPSIHWLRSPIRRVRYRLRDCPLYLYTESDLRQLLHRNGIKSYDITKIAGAGMDYVVCLNLG